ncbi:MAG: response regulator transcription factor [Bacteroidales bacterium]|nr:response regulator transcription factor [Bacteroidales bacterium]
MNWNDFKILLVDDELDILEFLSYNLKNEGFEIHTASNGADALKLAARIQPHLVLLDVMMPEMDGIETCEEIRKLPNMENTLIAFLTARGEDYSQIAGFEAGGDDYITKPIKPKLLISKIKSLLKRALVVNGQGGIDTSNKVISGDLVIDKDRYLVILKGREIVFPRKEFELISLLISKPDKVFSREEIFDSIWGDNIVVGDRTIDVHIRKLREKLGGDYIRTVKGIGYKYVKPA